MIQGYGKNAVRLLVLRFLKNWTNVNINVDFSKFLCRLKWERLKNVLYLELFWKLTGIIFKSIRWTTVKLEAKNVTSNIVTYTNDENWTYIHTIL